MVPGAILMSLSEGGCIIRKLKFKVDRKSLEHMYFSYVRPILEYADVIWDNCPNYIKENLEHINTYTQAIYDLL
jgi:hypothetical protein